MFDFNFIFEEGEKKTFRLSQLSSITVVSCVLLFVSIEHRKNISCLKVDESST